MALWGLVANSRRPSWLPSTLVGTPASLAVYCRSAAPVSMSTACAMHPAAACSDAQASQDETLLSSSCKARLIVKDSSHDGCLQRSCCMAALCRLFHQHVNRPT